MPPKHTRRSAAATQESTTEHRSNHMARADCSRSTPLHTLSRRALNQNLFVQHVTESPSSYYSNTSESSIQKLTHPNREQYDAPNLDSTSQKNNEFSKFQMANSQDENLVEDYDRAGLGLTTILFRDTVHKPQTFGFFLF